MHCNSILLSYTQHLVKMKELLIDQEQYVKVLLKKDEASQVSGTPRNMDLLRMNYPGLGKVPEHP